MIDLLMVAAFVTYSLTVGLLARRKASVNLDEYFLAGRSLSCWTAGCSMTATQYAADTPLLAAGLVATGGIFALWRLWIYGVAFLLLGLVLGRCWWRTGVITDAELCEIRYGGRSATLLRAFKAVFYGLVCNVASLAMVLAAAVRIAEVFLTWDAWLPSAVFDPIVRIVQALGVPLATHVNAPDVWIHTASNLISIVVIFLFTLTYSTTGGLRAVVATDVVQLAIVLLATGIYAVCAVARVGGLGALRTRLVAIVGSVRADALLAFEPSTAIGVSGAMIAVFGLQWLLERNSDGTGYLAQRTMACRSAAHATAAPVVFAFLQVVVRTLLWLPIFVALLVIYPLGGATGSGDVQARLREATFVQGIADLMPAGARGLMLVGMLAALASTLDTHLNWGSSYLTNDLFGRVICRGVLRREPGPRVLVWVARLCNPFLMILSLVVMSQLGSIQKAWHVTLLFGAGLGVPLMLRWLWWRMNAWGEIVAVVVALAAAPILLATVPAEAERLLVMGLLGAAGAVIGSLVTPRVDDAHLAAFYHRVGPPGFWPDPEARKRLVRGVAGLITAALTLFSLLVAAGTLLVGGTPPAYCPNRGLWAAGNLVVALVCVPIWWPMLRGVQETSGESS